MPQRRSRIVFFAAAAIGIAFLVTGCFPTTDLTTSAPTNTAAPTSPGAPSATPGAAPTPAPTKTAPPAAAGCAPTTATMPSTAISHKTIDVDGDGKADTEWIDASPVLEFGVTTASGATYSYPLATASPNAREGFIARLNDHRIVSLVDDSRSAYVHFFVNCGWVRTNHPNGTQYVLDFSDFVGTGSGVGCSFGYVESYQATNTATGYTVKETPLNLNGTGSVANPGATTTVVANASSSDPRVKVAQKLSCGAVTVSNGGVTFGE